MNSNNQIDIVSKNLEENIEPAPSCVDCAGKGTAFKNTPCRKCKGTGEAKGSIALLLDSRIILIEKIAGKVKNVGISKVLMTFFGWPVVAARRVIKRRKNKKEAEAQKERQAQREFYE